MIDVTKCIHFNKSDIPNGCTCYWDGECNHDCYYKQLVCKEQKCKELNERSVGFARKCQKLELDVCHLKDKNYNLQRQLDQLKAENEELKRELQAQCDFTAHEQKLIYCVAYDKTCKTGNDCKQEKCIFKDNIKLKQTLVEIKEIAESKVKPNLVKRMNGTAKYGIDRIIELAEVKDDRQS